MPKVSVVMASHNHEKYIAQTIESVLIQTYQDFELIITDDGSIDRTIDIIKSFNDRRIKLFCFPQNQAAGKATAMNNCINEATGEYIAVINSDDTWLPNKLEKQVKFLEAHSEMGAVFSYAQIIDENSNDLPDRSHDYRQYFIQKNKSRFEWLKQLFYIDNSLCNSSVLLRKVCYEITGLYDERYAQLVDLDFWIRLCMRYEIHIMPENLTQFRVRANEANVSGNPSNVMALLNLEATQVMKNYLNPWVAENFLKIFPLVTGVPEADVSVAIEKIEADLVPFFLGKMALNIDKVGAKSFGYDLLYQICSNPEIAQKLKSKYAFDFNNLKSLASQQDIFSIIHVGELEYILQRNNAEIAQIQLEKKAALDDLQNQLYQAEEVLKGYQAMALDYQDKYLKANTELEQSQSNVREYKHKCLEVQAELQQVKEQFETNINAEVQLIDELHQVEELLSEYETHIEQFEAITRSYQEKYLESQIQIQQVQDDAKKYQDKHHKSEEEIHKSEQEIHKYKIEVEQLKEQFHARISEAEKSIKDYQKQLKKAESVITDYNDRYEETQVELQKVRSQLHQNQAELKRHQSEYYQLIEELSILDQQTKQKEKTITEKQEVIVQLERFRNNIQEELKQLELLLQEYQNHIYELQQAMEDLLSSKQHEANTYNKEIDKLHQNHVETEIALANYQSQLQATQAEIEQLKSWQAFNDSQVSEGGLSKYKTLVWQAWQAYNSRNYSQMAKYLQQSLGQGSLSRAQAMIDWIENFSRFATLQGASLDTYSLTNLPEWQQLVRQVVRASPVTLSILAGSHEVLPK